MQADRLVMRHVGQPRGADHVADGVDSRHAGDVAVLRVGLDVVLDDLQLEVVGDEPLDIAQNADRHQHHLGLDGDLALGRLELGLDPRVGLFDLGRLGAGQDRQPALGEAFLQGGGDVFVFAGQDPVEQLDDRDLGADRVVEIAEFQADRPAADDEHRLRPGRQRHRFLV